MPALLNPGYLLPTVLASAALWRLLAFWRGVSKARALAAAVERYERRHSGSGLSILILGDSTGVGVGAHRPEDSVAGRLAADFPDADIINVSRSGARVRDAIAQVRQCDGLERRFDLAVLHVGGNDVVRATGTDQLAVDCDELMQELGRMADRTVWLGPANIGLAPLFPLPYCWLLSARSRAAAAVFARSAARHGVAFVDFSAPAHARRLGRDRRHHFAVDGFHPSSSTYGYGYAVAREAMLLATGVLAQTSGIGSA